MIFDTLAHVTLNGKWFLTRHDVDNTNVLVVNDSFFTGSLVYHFGEEPKNKST